MRNSVRLVLYAPHNSATNSQYIRIFLLNAISLQVTMGSCFVHCKVFTMGGRKPCKMVPNELYNCVAKEDITAKSMALTQ